MGKFGIEIIDPTGKAPVRAFIGSDDALWQWMGFESFDASEYEVEITAPENYRFREGAVVPKAVFERICSVPTTAWVKTETANVAKVHMVAKGLKETTREEFRKQGVSESRIVAVIPI